MILIKLSAKTNQESKFAHLLKGGSAIDSPLGPSGALGSSLGLPRHSRAPRVACGPGGVEGQVSLMVVSVSVSE